MIEVVMRRDSVCMADDVDAPHEETFELGDGASLWDVAKALARSSYLPMPSDAWGWTIEAEGAVIAVQRSFLRKKIQVLRGDPSSVAITDKACLFAIYARMGSQRRSDAVDRR